MSCQHGNWGGQCEICDEIDAAWKAGEASGKRSAEHCTCPACRITHASDCAVHNMPAMPNGPCDCGAVQSAHPARSGVVSDEDGMCNEKRPERRCVCREEFGYRVCGKDQTAERGVAHRAANPPAQPTKLEDAVMEVIALLRTTSNMPASDKRYAAGLLTAALQENAK